MNEIARPDVHHNSRAIVDVTCHWGSVLIYIRYHSATSDEGIPLGLGLMETKGQGFNIPSQPLFYSS